MSRSSRPNAGSCAACRRGCGCRDQCSVRSAARGCRRARSSRFWVGNEADVGRFGAQRAREMVARGGDVRWHDNAVDEPVFVAMRADDELRGVFGMLFVGILQEPSLPDRVELNAASVASHLTFHSEDLTSLNDNIMH